jgi:hypothetical protein
MSYQVVCASGAADGAGGVPIIGEIVESTKRPSTSDAWYLIGVAVPVKVGSGSKVTAPVVGFTV